MTNMNIPFRKGSTSNSKYEKISINRIDGANGILSFWEMGL